MHVALLQPTALLVLLLQIAFYLDHTAAQEHDKQSTLFNLQLLKTILLQRLSNMHSQITAVHVPQQAAAMCAHRRSVLLRLQRSISA